MADEAQSILAPTQIDNSLKADAWQAFKDTANEREFGAKLQTMSLPQNVKADLWEAKRRAGTNQLPAQPSGIPDAIAQARAVALRPLTNAPRPVGDVLSQSGNAANPTPQTGATDTGAGLVKALPAIGGAVGGALGNIPGAALGGIVGEGAKQALAPSAGLQRSDNPPLAMLGEGALQGGLEGGGQLLSAAGKALDPTALKRAAATFFRGEMDRAGQAIDGYLKQPNIATKQISIAKPVNDIMDAEIARAQKVGADNLADRLTELKGSWNKNFNLQNPTPLEANQFRREVGRITSFLGDANKVTINKIQKEIVGSVGSEIEKVAPGVRPLNDAYANVIAKSTALKGTVKKSTRGFTGVGLAMASAAAQKAGAVAPNIIRAGQVAVEEQ